MAFMQSFECLFLFLPLKLCLFLGFVTPGPSNAALSCLTARQLCSEDPVCSQILEILPKVCGLELGKLSIVPFKEFSRTEYRRLR